MMGASEDAQEAVKAVITANLHLRVAAKVESMLRQTEDFDLLVLVLEKVVDRMAELEGGGS